MVIFLRGGCDSFNVLVPLGQCRGETDLYDEYRQVREIAALPKSKLLPIDVRSSPTKQPCDTFGVHHSLPYVTSLYEAHTTTHGAHDPTVPYRATFPPSALLIILRTACVAAGTRRARPRSSPTSARSRVAHGAHPHRAPSTRCTAESMHHV